MAWPFKKNREQEIAVEQKPLRRRYRRFSLKRIYKAALNDRLNEGWLAQGGDINNELRSSLHTIRSRARGEEQNSCLARRFLALCENHIVGPNGFTLQVQGKLKNGKLDKKHNKLIASDFKKWAKRGVCEITGKYSFKECQRLWARSGPRDGEVLTRLHDVKPTTKNPWGFVIELLDPARLDHRLNENLSNGNRIRLGIEVNQANQPIKYHLKKGERMGLMYERVSYEPVPAEDIVHWFLPDQPEQLRAVSWMVAGLSNLHQQEEYKETAIVAARGGASKMGFIQGGTAHAVADGQDEDGELYEELEAGVMGHLGADQTFIGFDPKYPHENYDPFMKTNDRYLAVGWGVSYHALTDDLADVNFSSIRTGTLEQRDNFKTKQDSFSAILDRVFERYLVAAAYNNPPIKNTSQEVIIERFSDYLWRGRRWDWVNPKDDIVAIIMAINAGLGSPQRYASELGIEIEDLLDEIAAFTKMLEDKGISLSELAAKAASNDEEEGKDNGDGNGKDKEETKQAA